MDWDHSLIRIRPPTPSPPPRIRLRREDVDVEIVTPRKRTRGATRTRDVSKPSKGQKVGRTNSAILTRGNVDNLHTSGVESPSSQMNHYSSPGDVHSSNDVHMHSMHDGSDVDLVPSPPLPFEGDVSWFREQDTMDDYQYFVEAIFAGECGFYQLSRRLFVVNGWNYANNTSNVSMPYIQLNAPT